MILRVGEFRLPLARGYGPVAVEFARIREAMFHCDVEQLHLAGDRLVLVNWRAVRTVEPRVTP